MKYKRVHSTVASSHSVEDSLDSLKSGIIGNQGCKCERYLAAISVRLKPDRLFSMSAFTSGGARPVARPGSCSDKSLVDSCGDDPTYLQS